MSRSSSSEMPLDSVPRCPDAGPDLDRLPIEVRPNRRLLTYYGLTSLLLGPFFLILLIPRSFRYRTLRYRIDDEGIAMQWGILFHREISLSYARIQDIHLSSNMVERRLGLGKIEIQTASASAGAEMTIEGIPGLERVRDFLYGRMRGAKGARGASAGSAGTRTPMAGGDARAPAEDSAELAEILLDIAREVRELRRDLEVDHAGDREEGSSRG